MFKQHTNFNSRDRFIPRRSGSDSEFSNYLLSSPSNNQEFFDECDKVIKNNYGNISYEHWRISTYQKRLESIMPLLNRKILNICPTNYKLMCKESFVQDWPVHRRRKPVIGRPVKILDMPNIHMRKNYCQYLTDWSVKGTIASIFEQEIYLWHPEGMLSYDVTSTTHRVEECVKWNRNGTYFAACLKGKAIGLFNSDKNKILCENVCKCEYSNCVITALEWSSRNLLITGCYNGVICVWNDELMPLEHYEVHSGVIFRIALSSQERFLVSSSHDCCCCIMIWPTMEPYFKIQDVAPLKGIAWHPWRDSLLATAGFSNNGSVTLFHVSSKQKIATQPPIDENLHVVDYLSFSPLTGELVVSYWNQTAGTINASASINVLSNLLTLDDSIHYHKNRVFHLLWGDDGASLGSISEDENFCVWDFYGKETDAVKIQLKSEKKRKYTLNPVDNLNVFGKTLR